MYIIKNGYKGGALVYLPFVCPN